MSNDLRYYGNPMKWESTKGDLISREALKKALKSNCMPEICHDYGTNWCEACCPHNDFEDLIDNAPTVEPTFGLFKEMLCADCGIPTGEWVYDDTINNWKCSECGETPKTIGYVGTAKFMHDEFKFCNHCGAYMIKEGNND